MILSKSLHKKMLRDLYQRKALLIALMILLALAISCFIELSGVYSDLNESKNHYYQQLKLADFFIDLKRAPLANLPLLKHNINFDLDTRIAVPIMIAASTQANINFPIAGTGYSFPTHRQPAINQILLTTGTFFSTPNSAEAIILAQFATAHHLKPGDHLAIRLPSGQQNVLIVGTASSAEYIFVKSAGAALAPDPANYAVIWFPEKYLSSQTNLTGAYNQLLGRNNKPWIHANESESLNTLASALESSGVAEKTLRQDQISVKIVEQQLSNIHVSTEFFPVIFLLVAALVVNVLITRLVTQQRTVIGTLKALGISNHQLVLHYLSYGIIIGLCGGLLGILLGLWLQHLLLSYYMGYFQIPEIQLHFYFSHMLVGLCISLITALLGSYSGVKRALQLAPAEAMRPESPTLGKHNFLENIPYFWQKLNFRGKLITRSIFRNRFRSMVTIISTAAATALLLSTICLYDSIYRLIEIEYNHIEHEDISLSLRNSMGPEVLSTLNTLPNVAHIEPQLMVSGLLKSSHLEKQVEITGLPANPQLFTPIDAAGNTLQFHEPGLTLSKILADELQVNVGDWVQLKLLSGTRTTSEVPIIKIIQSYLGLPVYANQLWLSRQMDNSWAANNILIQFKDNQHISNFENAVAKLGQLISMPTKQHSKELLLDSLNKFMVMFIVIMVLFSGAIAIATMLNNALIALSERERDIATFSVLGMSQREIFQLFLSEAIILNSLGLLLGLLAGIGLTHLMTIAYGSELYRFPLVIKILRLLQASGLILVFFIISYTLIYNMITRVKWLMVLNTRE